MSLFLTFMRLELITTLTGSLNQFEVPKLNKGEQVWLKFRGINYSADMFLNGKKINPETHQGMFLREKYLITPFLEKGINPLAVLVHPPDPVGALTDREVMEQLQNRSPCNLLQAGIGFVPSGIAIPGFGMKWPLKLQDRSICSIPMFRRRCPAKEFQQETICCIYCGFHRFAEQYR